ncbi:hypothetical protein ACLB2K_030109 [Fragaria x ananassa]
MSMAAEETRKPEAAAIDSVAAIFGVTGLVGKVLARKLISKPKWKVYGIARAPDNQIIPINQSCSNFHFIQCDLLNPLETQKRLSLLQDVTHVFWVTWASQYQLDSIECCDQNKAMLSNALDAIIPGAMALKHVTLQTGMKHYVSLHGPFDENEARYYNEESPRVNPGCNFYYVLEDLLKERLHGTKKCWEETCIDGSDARLVADQQIWAATTADLDENGHSFNAINGPSFTWKDIWKAVAGKLGVQVSEEHTFSEDFWYSKAMADKQQVWKQIVAEKGLIENEMDNLANWDFLDVLFRCPVKILGTRDKVDGLGFDVRYKTVDSIMYWIDCMRDEKLIP